MATVIAPVSDVWTAPPAANTEPTSDQRETQVLFGEVVFVHASSGPWVRIEAVEQPEYTHHQRWEGYPGWVLKKALGPLPTKTTVPSKPRGVIPFAKTFLGTPYLWGGMTKKGIDCSGLVHVAYRQHGLKIPRDAYEQWMKAKPITRAALRPADLIFSSKDENPKKITHVAIYLGGDKILEAPQTGLAVREISFQDKYGEPLEQVESGNHVGDRYVFFGSFLHS
jgi:cell wall-associated NlpC family hydrolase